MTEYQEMFLSEAAELFSNAYERALAAEEQDFLDAESIAELFRILHTIKGSSGGVEFGHLSRYAHALENLLARLRDNEIGYKSGMASFMVDSLDVMQEILEWETKGAIDERDFNAKLDYMEAQLSQFGTEQGVQAVKEQTGEEGFMLFDEVDIEKLKGETEVKDEPIAMEENDEKRTAEKIQTASIRVDLEKIDLLLNRVGELVITNAMISRIAEGLPNDTLKEELIERLELLERHIRDLQDAVMSVRMVPLEHIYAKLPKIVRNLAKKLGKQVRFKHSGGGVEIDKIVIEGLNDPLMHILRNAVDHGVESVEEREDKGKDASALITVSAAQENGQIIISVSDDGRGIDVEKVVKKAVEKKLIAREQAEKLSDDDKLNLIFLQGLTTVDRISDISGRGVGMDIVRSNVEKLGGIVRLHSTTGRGTRFSIVLPLTLAILDGLNVTIGENRYILPLSAVVESLQPTEEMIRSSSDGSHKILILRDRFIPIIMMHELFNITTKCTKITDGMLIIVRAGEEWAALFVDSFGAQQQVVVKSLEKNFRHVKGIGGAMVQGDGAVELILDPLGIVNKALERQLNSESYYQ
ncbi:MAG: chemotaxis protein CheA [Helicobacteraceae bacterium]|jgi:two-component system chemotaxis sensor kinase CheA|nr:chemotaxis protein CheA [Helicobacteraceae bacterium]